MSAKRTNTSLGLVLAAVIAAALLAACLLAGCSNSAGPSVPDPPDDYRIRLTPDDVMANLRTAYVYRDLEPYLDCLSEDFIFYPTQEDVQDPNNGIPPEWYKAEERAMHENMFDEGSNVESISLTLTDVSVEHDPGVPQDPRDDIYVYLEAVDVRVNLHGDLTYLATAPSEFHIRVDPDEDGPHGEILWEIYLWFDDPVQRGTGECDSPIEDASWGSIKAIYQ